MNDTKVWKNIFKSNDDNEGVREPVPVVVPDSIQPEATL